MIKYIKSSSWNNISDLRFGGKDLRDFKAMLDTVEHQHKDVQSSRRGYWYMGTGGYDKWYYIEYCDNEVIEVVSGEVGINSSSISDTDSLLALVEYAKYLAKAYRYKMSPEWEVESFYDVDLRGLASSVKFNDFSEAAEYAHEKLGQGCGAVCITNLYTGVEQVLDYDEYFEDFEGEFPYSYEDFI